MQDEILVSKSGRSKWSPSFSIVLLLVLILCTPACKAQRRTSVNHTCSAAETSIPLEGDDGVDITATTRYQLAVVKLLSEEQFNALDCLANAERNGKAKFAGGMWKLHLLHGSVAQPIGGLQHATEEDWEAHLRLLQRWLDWNPDSVTARIALAAAYANSRVGSSWWWNGRHCQQ